MTRTRRVGALGEMVTAIVLLVVADGCSSSGSLPGPVDSGSPLAVVTDVTKAASTPGMLQACSACSTSVLLRQDGAIVVAGATKPQWIYRIWLVAGRGDSKAAPTVGFVYDGNTYFQLDVPSGVVMNPDYLLNSLNAYFSTQPKIAQPADTPIIRSFEPATW